MTWRWFSSRKLELLIEAIENGDTTIRFPVRGTKSVNAMLNRINAMLSRMRRDAAERERYYELIVDSVESGIMVVDAKGYVVRCNDAACRLFGMETVTHLKRLAEFEASLPQKILEAAAGARFISTGVASGRSMSLSLRISNITLRGETLKIVSITNIGSELDDCEIDSWQRLTRVMTHEIMNFAGTDKIVERDTAVASRQRFRNHTRRIVDHQRGIGTTVTLHIILPAVVDSRRPVA